MTQEKKQTAVEFLIQEMKKLNISVNGIEQDKAILISEQALAMEREQIIESYRKGVFDIMIGEIIFTRETSKQYYNETYGK